MVVRFGIDVLLERLTQAGGPPPAWRRVGLVTNDAARLGTDATCRTREGLLRAGVPLQRLFGPEHGLIATAIDGARVDDTIDTVTGLPVVSLYGARMRPTAEQLGDLDVLLFDIPDVGARCYTYAWTLFHALRACADVSVPLLVLDRPNPLGGCLHVAEGPVLEKECRSFIGEDDIPLRHSLTLGELARLWQREHWPAAMLEVVPCEGWNRKQAWPAVGRPWIPPSPAMPSFESTIWYPGTCLFEATNLSVGRGTDVPFAQIGAPWLRAEAVIERVAGEAAQIGARLRACEFMPTEGPWRGTSCRGIRIVDATPPDGDRSVWIAQTTRPVQLGLALLDAIVRQHPDDFSWAHYPTAANPTGTDHFARLIGRADLHAAMGAQSREDRIGLTAVPDWRERCALARLY